MPEETNVDSFVLRFVREASAAEVQGQGSAWRGVIRHVQTNRERSFTRWADALTFIREFVDLCEEPPDE